MIGLLGVLPAFFLGCVVGGTIGGVFAALLSALYHQFLVRSMGSDNDIWNIVLPLFMLWALCAALRARTTSRQIWYGVLAGVVCGLHAGTWQGWRFFFVLSLGGLLGSVLLYGCKHVLQRRTGRVWQSAAVKINALSLRDILGERRRERCLGNRTIVVLGSAWQPLFGISTPSSSQKHLHSLT